MTVDLMMRLHPIDGEDPQRPILTMKASKS
jgi:hypothetical protein